MKEIFFEDVVKTIRESLLVLDSELKILFANDSFYKVFHTTVEETTNKTIFTLGNGQWDIKELRDLLEKILPAKNTIENYEVSHQFPDIGYKVMLINAREIIDGPKKKILVAIEDITAQKKATEYAMQKSRLSSVGQLSAGIAHGLSSPLTGIQNFLETYYREEEKNSPKREELALMLEGCKYMGDIIKNLTHFSSEKEEEKTKLRLVEVIESVLLFTERMFMSRNIKIIKEYSKEESQYIMANMAQLQQTFMNILINSMESIEDKGSITIKESSTDTSVCVEIIDTGKGIRKEDAPKVFDPFFTTKKDKGGSGLGLSSAQEIITQHKGSLTIHSEEDKGTKVTITLPRCPGE